VNNVVGPIFNKNFVEKRGLWVPCTVHGTHWNSVNALLKKNGEIWNTDVKLSIQTDATYPFGYCWNAVHLRFTLFSLKSAF